MKSKLAAILLLTTCLFQIRSAAAVSAPAASSLSVRPFIQQVVIGPADTTKKVNLTVSNNSKYSQTFHASAVDFGALNETGGLTFQGQNSSAINSQYGLVKWLSLDKPDFALAAGQQTTLTATITNDSTLTPGAHYSAIIISASGQGQQAGKLTITPKVSSLIFATKQGGDTYDIHLQSLSQNGSIWRLPSEVNVRLKSTGNTFITPRGIVWLAQGNNQVYKGLINQQSALVLPGSTRNFNVVLNKIGTLHKSLFLTNYTLRVDYRYDGNPNFATQQFKYQVINWATVTVLLVLISVLIIVVRAYGNLHSWSEPSAARPKRKVNK